MANTRAQKTAQNLSTLTTAGDIAYASAAGTPARLGIGSSAQVLTVASGVPSWATASGGGKVLQVVSSNYSTLTSNSTSTFEPTGLTATITPTLNTSKILVLVAQNGITKNSLSSPSQQVGLKLLRGATALVTMSGMMYNSGSATQMVGTGSPMAYLDSPATTSATTYSTKFSSESNDASVSVQYNSSPSQITLLEIGA